MRLSLAGACFGLGTLPAPDAVHLPETRVSRTGMQQSTRSALRLASEISMHGPATFAREARLL